MAVFKGLIGDRLDRMWTSSRGVQSWLGDAARKWVAEAARRSADRISPRQADHRASRPGASVGNGASLSSIDTHGPHPKETEELRSLINFVKDAILNLDDVRDYEVVRAIDDDMYYLWKELERKMQAHRQSEAKFQLREMFRI